MCPTAGGFCAVESALGLKASGLDLRRRSAVLIVAGHIVRIDLELAQEQQTVNSGKCLLSPGPRRNTSLKSYVP